MWRRKEDECGEMLKDYECGRGRRRNMDNRGGMWRQ